MVDISAEKLAQRAFDTGLLDNQQLELAWSELGTREASGDDFVAVTIRRELLTNFQIERLSKAERYGYFYGDYKLLYMVGAGTFARVYRGVARSDDRVVAIKVLRQRYNEDESVRDNFLREAQMVMNLRHPNVVPIYDVGTERDRPYMGMEFIEGSNLRSFVIARKKLTLLESLRIMRDVAAGLEYSIGQGVSHRDLKLSNVLVSSVGRGKLVDFGLAAMEVKTGGVNENFNPRSIDYAGLERSTGVRRNDPRSDLYFAGVMLYHMLSGHPPLAETKDRAARLSVSRFREIKPLIQLEPTLPLFVIQLVHKAMELDVTKRHGSAAELLSDLKIAIHRVERGETEAGKEQEEVTAVAEVNKSEGREGAEHTVMVIESHSQMQNALRERLKRRGYRVLVISDVDRALERFEDGDPVADGVVFSSAELGEQAVEGFNRLGKNEKTSDIPAVLLVDKRHKDLIRQAETSDHRRLLGLPLKVRQLRALLKQLIVDTAAERNEAAESDQVAT